MMTLKELILGGGRGGGGGGGGGGGCGLHDNLEGTWPTEANRIVLS